jgi:hypothetical protein
LYFGEAVALYFTFLGFYTTSLLVPMVLGFLQLFLPSESIAFFCVFNVLWVSVFLEVSTDSLRRRWLDNIKMDLREIGWDDMDWIDLAHDRDQWRALVKAVMNLWVP